MKIGNVFDLKIFKPIPRPRINVCNCCYEDDLSHCTQRGSSVGKWTRTGFGQMTPKSSAIGILYLILEA